MSVKPTLVVQDFTENFNAIVKKFRKDAVLIGIPEDDTKREEDSPISNAALLAITNFGSPHNNVPPWPVMAIGIRNAQDAVAEQFKLAAQKVLTGGLSALEIAYERVGIIASNSVKKAINSQEAAPPLAEETLAARKSDGFKGTKRGIVTGQMRNAITYVVKPGGSG